MWKSPEIVQTTNNKWERKSFKWFLEDNFFYSLSELEDVSEPLSASAKTLICELRKYVIQPQWTWATSVAALSEAGSMQISCLTCERSREICLSLISFGAKYTFPAGVREFKIINLWGHVLSLPKFLRGPKEKPYKNIFNWMVQFLQVFTQ